MFKWLLVFLSLISFDFKGFAFQDKQKIVIQFSGVIVTGDSLQPVPFTGVIVKGKNRGTYSDVYGFFSFAALVGDTVIFSSVGFRPGRYVIPDTLKENRYSIIHVLHTDTISLNETIIRAFPTREQFKQAFLNLNIKDDALARASSNMNAAAYYRYVKNMDVDATTAYKAYAGQNNTQIFNNGIYPSINLTNPLAWVQFVDSWQKGELGRYGKEKKKTNDYKGNGDYYLPNK